MPHTVYTKPLLTENKRRIMAICKLILSNLNKRDTT